MPGHVSPDQLHEAASTLRACAQQLRQSIPDYSSTLSPVLALDTPSTWTGGYSTQVSAQIKDLRGGLGGGVQSLLDLADSWENAASQMDNQAASPDGGSQG